MVLAGSQTMSSLLLVALLFVYVDPSACVRKVSETDQGSEQPPDAEKRLALTHPSSALELSGPQGAAQKQEYPEKLTAPATSSALAGASHIQHAAINSVLLSQIFVMCVVMYGGMGLAWSTNWRAMTDANLPRTHFHTGLLCVTWASTSVGMHVLNKSLVTYLQAPALISAVQMVIASVFVGFTAYKEFAKAPRQQLLRWMFVPMLFATMLLTSFYAYERISLSLLTVTRNLTPLVVLPIECLLMPPEARPVVSFPAVTAIFVMLAGALTYGGGNLASISLLGVAFAVLNMFTAASDRLLQRRLLTQECKDLHPSVCTVFNNLVGLAPTLLLACTTGQMQEALQQEQMTNWLDPRILVLLAMSGLIGIGICYLGFECQRAISATSFFVMQNVSKVAVVSAGILFFGDPISSPLSATGLLLSLGGSLMYGHAQQQQSQQPKQHPIVAGAAAESNPNAKDRSK